MERRQHEVGLEDHIFKRLTNRVRSNCEGVVAGASSPSSEKTLRLEATATSDGVGIDKHSLRKAQQCKMTL